MSSFTTLSETESEQEVTLEDQKKIHSFAKLNSRVVEIKADIEQGTLDLEKFNDAAKGIGNISYLDSQDGVLRSIPMLLKIDNDLWPSLSLETLRVFHNHKNILKIEKLAPEEKNVSDRTFRDKEIHMYLILKIKYSNKNIPCSSRLVLK